MSLSTCFLLSFLKWKKNLIFVFILILLENVLSRKLQFLSIRENLSYYIVFSYVILFYFILCILTSHVMCRWHLCAVNICIMKSLVGKFISFTYFSCGNIIFFFFFVACHFFTLFKWKFCGENFLLFFVRVLFWKSFRTFWLLSKFARGKCTAI